MDAGQPVSHLLMPMRAVVVQDEVLARGLGELRVQPAQKFQKFLAATARVALADPLALHHLQSGEERGGARSFIIVREGVAPSALERPARAVQSLNLALLIHAEDDGVLRWGRIHARWQAPNL